MSTCCHGEHDHGHHHDAPGRDWLGYQRSAIAMIWAATFLYTAFGSWATILVAPWQRIVLAVAGLVMIALALLRLLGQRHQAKTPGASETVIHALPLLLLCAIPAEDPGASFVDRMGWGGMRETNPVMARARIASELDEPIVLTPRTELSFSGSAGRFALSEELTLPEAEDIDPSYRSITLLEAYRAGSDWDGQLVETIISTATLTPQRLRQLPTAAQESGAPLIGFRLVMICCISDAWPISVLLISDGTALDGIGDNQWLRVRGRMRMINTERGPLMQLTVNHAAAVSRPRWPYLSPL